MEGNLRYRVGWPLARCILWEGGSFCSGGGAVGFLESEEAALMSSRLCYSASPGLQMWLLKVLSTFQRELQIFGYRIF